MGDLPKFDYPPLVEVAVGVQFRPVFSMRGLRLAPLQELWREDYPKVEEHPALPPVFEGSPVLVPQFQFNVVELPPTRQWFLNESGTQLIQVQPDRLLINWRKGEPPSEYPRYRHMRANFNKRFTELAHFAQEERLGPLEVTQVELSYVNVIDAEPENLGRVETFLKSWSGTSGHHLGVPEQTRMTLTFMIPDVGLPPVRMYAEVNPAQGPNGKRVLFFTLTARGNPGGETLDESLKFLDEVRNHLARSFFELTEDSMHEVWGLRV